MENETASLFCEPVPKSLKDYHEIITNPMDLGTMYQHLKSGNKYKSMNDSDSSSSRYIYITYKTYIQILIKTNTNNK